MQFADETARPTTVKDNVFRDVVKTIATDTKAVKSYTFEEKDPDKAAKRLAADKRLMAEAGNDCVPPVTIKAEMSEYVPDGGKWDGKTRKVYFWSLGRKITRERTDKKA